MAARHRLGLLLLLPASQIAGGCGAAPSALTPHGVGARHVADLWWILAATAAAVYLVVMALTAIALVRRRTPIRDDQAAVRWVVIGGLGIPAAVVGVLFVVAVGALGRLAGPPSPAALAIEVTGYQWWWSVTYQRGDERVVTANEIHVPVGVPVRLRLLSADVIHSFWVPALAGKLDLVPGQVNETWLQAERPGVYRGQCAEFCGLQHARMGLLVVAQPAAEFEAWWRQQREPAAAPSDPVGARGLEVFARNCAGCHAVRGTAAFYGRTGPDLTHLASRRTLAAGVLDNVRGALAGWIANPQVLKPGNRMPPVALTSEDLHAVVRYLEGLR